MSTFFLDDMVGKIATKVYENQYRDELTFEFEDGTKCKFFHYQDCCESVSIEDVNGDYEDLIGTPILVAEVRDWEPEGYKPPDWGDVEEWTFYTFRTIKGSVDVRWYGTSNGYYSTAVSMDWGKV